MKKKSVSSSETTRHIVAILLLAVILASPVLAINEGVPVFEDEPLQVEKTYSDTPDTIGLLESVFRVIGLNRGGNFVAIGYAGKHLGTVPAESKFAELPLHDYCLPYQFGTEDFYRCEGGL